MKNREKLKEMTALQLQETNGGGFAYDVGRVLRFLAISAGQPIGTVNAMADWTMNAVVNEIENP